MRCTEILKARVPPPIKAQAKAVADRELLTESAWLKRLVVRELRASAGAGDLDTTDQIAGREVASRRQRARCVYVRLRPEDMLLLAARAEARSMRPATYLSVLTRSHLRSLAPLPKDEYGALMDCIEELGAIGRNINQIARAANSGRPLPNSVAAELRAMLRICEGLRTHTKALLLANLKSWNTGHNETIS